MRSLVARAAFAFTLICALTPAALHAQGARRKVALMPLSGTNVHPDYLQAGRDIMKDHLLGTGQFDVLTVAGESGPIEVTAAEAIERARPSGAELVLVAHLARLSGAGRLRLMAYRLADGGLVHADSIGIAGGPDDLDPALKRLAQGLATGKRVENNAEIDTVTQKDAGPMLKQRATKSFGLRLGTSVALNRPGDLDPASVPNIGIFWMYDARKFLADVSLDLLISNDNGGGLQAGIGGYYPFARGDLTTYLGAQAAFMIGTYGGAGASGIRLAPVFGFLFGRLSSVQIRGELGYFFNTFSEKPSSDYQYPVAGGAPVRVNGEGRFAHGPQLSIGLGF